MPSLDRDWARPGPTSQQVRHDVFIALVAAALMVRVGGVAYERTLLRTGGRIGYREALAPTVRES